MNKFVIDNTDLFYPDSFDLDELDFEIASTPKNYQLKGFKNINSVSDLVNTNLSNQGCIIVDKKVFDIHLKNLIKIDKERIYLIDATESIKNILCQVNIEF